jgi:phosphoribosylglycinamide formyltransferase-1
MGNQSQHRFFSEPITPVTGTADSSAMAEGEPGLPREFIWQDHRLHIARVLRAWRETGRCRHGSSESYVRKHWFEVETTAGQKAQIYFERKPRDRRKTKRWWLYTMEGDPTFN